MDVKTSEKSIIDAILAKIGIFATILVLFSSFDAVLNQGLLGSIQSSNRFFYFMLALMILSAVSFVYNSMVRAENDPVIWVSFLFVMLSVFLTILSGLYPLSSLKSLIYNISVWAFILNAVYYGVRYTKKIYSHVILVILCFPVLVYLIINRTSNMDIVFGMNVAYYLLYLAPILLLTKSKILSTAVLLTEAAIIILSYKRTGMIAIITAILIYYYFENRKDKGIVSKRVFGFMIFIVALGTAYYIYTNLSSTYSLNWVEHFQNMLDSGGSGRAEIYKMIISSLKTQDFISWILGNGYLATNLKLGEWAHNDFLEILYDYGIFGITLYILFLGLLIKKFLKMKKDRYEYYPAFAVSLVLLFWGALFSQMIVFPYWFLGLALFWGITLADYKNMTEKKKMNEISISVQETNEENI